MVRISSRPRHLVWLVFRYPGVDAVVGFRAAAVLAGTGVEFGGSCSQLDDVRSLLPVFRHPPCRRVGVDDPDAGTAEMAPDRSLDSTGPRCSGDVADRLSMVVGFG